MPTCAFVFLFTAQKFKNTQNCNFNFCFFMGRKLGLSHSGKDLEGDISRKGL
jgi:hypothetical protein